MNSVPAVQPDRKSAPFQAGANLEPLSEPLQPGFRFFLPPLPPALSPTLTLRFPEKEHSGGHEAYHVPRMPPDGVGAASPPGEL
jgi:hypothetical protein